jgi:predicted  nucleic acid-binding Zn-ribbon protein
MGLNLAQIDRLLNEWKSKIDAVSQNLLDLYDLPAYQRVTGSGNPLSSLTGITQQRIGEALTAIDSLFNDLQLLTNLLDRAKQLRKKIPSLFINDESLQEIYQLLTGNSIQLPNIYIPLAQRDLLSPIQQLQAISPAELLDRMMSDFTIARDAFVAANIAWIELESKLIANHQSLIELQQLAQKLQVPIPPALITAQTNFTNLQHQIDRDPLGVNQTFTQDLTPLINNIRHELATISQQYQQLQTKLVTARQQLAQLQQLERDSIAAYTESQAKFSHSLSLIAPLPPEELAAMAQWLERLIAKFELGTIAPVHVGLTNWTNKIQAYTTTARFALAANRLPLNTRQELRGRLDALSAKALAKGMAEDPILADLVVQARQVLYTSPTALDLAIDLVKQYEQRLNQQLAC